MLKYFVGNPIDVAEVHRGISIKDPHMMMAYIDNATATAASIGKAGWMRIEDVAYMEKGKIRIIDRAKQIAPVEMRVILLAHPSTINAAVIGKPGSEGTCAYVQPKPKPAPDHKAASYDVADEKSATRKVKHSIKQRLTRNKWLGGGVRFVDNIPRNASGKDQESKLRAMDAEQAMELAYGWREKAMGRKTDRHKGPIGVLEYNYIDHGSLTGRIVLIHSASTVQE